MAVSRIIYSGKSFLCIHAARTLFICKLSGVNYSFPTTGSSNCRPSVNDVPGRGLTHQALARLPAG
jgi:hypothetical protein